VTLDDVMQSDFAVRERTEASIRGLHSVHTEVAYEIAEQVAHDHAERLERCAADLPGQAVALSSVIEALRASQRNLRWAEETLGRLVSDLRTDARAQEPDSV
jgi:hypothetical protein